MSLILFDRFIYSYTTYQLMESDFKEEKVDDDNWGNPPSPLTPENQKKAFRAQLILGLVALVGIFLPGVLFWFFGR
jgi:hypothetical protein